jgi:hypothetical protein
LHFRKDNTQMETTIAASFQSRIGARDAIAALIELGLSASDISVAEAETGVGTVFGTARTLSPGRGTTDISTILQPQYPVSARGGMPGGMVAETPEDVQASLMDFGLSETAAKEGETALAEGAVVLAVTVDETLGRAVSEAMERNEGRVFS